MKKTIVSAALGALALGVAFSSPAAAADVTACLITKTDTNPFFVKMKEGAEAKAKELGVTLKAYAGKIDGDSESQVAAIETCIADGAKGILITASDTKGIVPSVQKARDAGLLVIALDTPLEPLDAADMTFATDNLLAGELIGKWARVPYWQCLTLDQTHPHFQRQMQDWYTESGPSGQFNLVKASLKSRGYLATDSESMAIDSPVVRGALAKFQADRGMPVSGVVDLPTYVAALSDFVALSADGSFTRIGWSSSGPQQVATADGSTAPALGLTTAAPWMIDLQIENPQPAGERAAFTEGEQIFLSAMVSRASHLYCYYTDSSGGVMRVLPNALQPHSLVSANQGIRIPDWMAPNPGFILDAGKPGTEAMICVATSQDAEPHLPAEMRVPALSPIRGVKGVEGVQQVFGSALGGTNTHVSQVMRWQVAPRRQAQAVPKTQTR